LSSTISYLHRAILPRAPFVSINRSPWECIWFIVAMAGGERVRVSDFEHVI
jgi:hypothetical protein